MTRTQVSGAVETPQSVHRVEVYLGFPRLEPQAALAHEAGAHLPPVTVFKPSGNSSSTVKLWMAVAGAASHLVLIIQDAKRISSMD